MESKEVCGLDAQAFGGFSSPPKLRNQARSSKLFTIAAPISAVVNYRTGYRGESFRPWSKPTTPAAAEQATRRNQLVLCVIR